MTKVLLVDDHELFVDAARVALVTANSRDHEVCFEVVGSATSGSEVLPLVSRLRPDLVLLDIGLPGLDGLAVLELLHARHPEVTVVMLTANEQEEHVQAALTRGAAGYILKTIHPADLPAALRQLVEQTVYVPLPASAESIAANDHGLSERELEIVQHLVRGLSNRAIGEKLFVTEQTVKFHLTNIYRKLGVQNRTTAAREAHRLGITASPHIDSQFAA
jgi:DNA-binding NarL/FixJ family response regulator